MTLYKIGGDTVEKGADNFETLLAAAYGARQRPKCLCRPGGIDMYVARIDERYVIKRMPYTGDDHDPVCPSYEPPPELSGLGEVLGSAIIEVPDLDATTLRLQFALTKSGGRAAPKPGEGDAESVKTDARNCRCAPCCTSCGSKRAFTSGRPPCMARAIGPCCASTYCKRPGISR